MHIFQYTVGGRIETTLLGIDKSSMITDNSSMIIDEDIITIHSPLERRTDQWFSFWTLIPRGNYITKTCPCNILIFFSSCKT